MEKTMAVHVDARQEAGGWTLYMPPEYLDLFLTMPLEVPFRLDMECLLGAAPGLRAEAQKLREAGLQRLRLRFDEQGRVSSHLAMVTRREDESFNDTAHRLMEEATQRCRALLDGVLEEAAPRFRFRQAFRGHLNKQESALWRLRGLVSLLRACDASQADEVTWDEVADAMETFIDEIKDAFTGLNDEYIRAIAEGDDAEASPTAGKEEGEASEEQDS